MNTFKECSRTLLIRELALNSYRQCFCVNVDESIPTEEPFWDIAGMNAIRNGNSNVTTATRSFSEKVILVTISPTYILEGNNLGRPCDKVSNYNQPITAYKRTPLKLQAWIYRKAIPISAQWVIMKRLSYWPSLFLEKRVLHVTIPYKDSTVHLLEIQLYVIFSAQNLLIRI